MSIQPDCSRETSTAPDPPFSGSDAPQPSSAGALMGMIRESSRQSSANVLALEELERYWDESPGSSSSKLENFTKYVTRESLTKFLCRSDVFRQQLDVHGSVVELGVARGASLLTWAHLSAILEPTNYLREVVGFDTFQGFPHVAPEDCSGASGSESEHLHVGGFQVEGDMASDIERSARIHDHTRFLNHIPKVHVVPGDVMETLPNYLEENPQLVVSLLHLDLDLYEPTKLALELLVPRMPRGGVILFDELGMRQFPGETLATLETLGLGSLAIRRFPYGTCMSYAVLGDR